MVKSSPSNAGGEGSIPSRGAEIPHALWPENQNIKQKQYCNKFNKDFKKKKNTLVNGLFATLVVARNFFFQVNIDFHVYYLASFDFNDY